MLRLDDFLSDSELTLAPGPRRPVLRVAPVNRAARSLLQVRQEKLAHSAEVLAADFERCQPTVPVLRQAVLRDLAWLCVYLEQVEEESEGIGPARRALLGFLQDQAPDQASSWLEVGLLDAPLRWAFRVRVAATQCDALHMLLLPLFLFGAVFDDCKLKRFSLEEASLVALAELEAACQHMPGWTSSLDPVRRLITGEASA